MSENWIEIDGVPETELPAHLKTEGEGDRVRFVEGGFVLVQGGRATFVPFREVLGTVSDRGSAYVLVPRRPPAHPWVRVGQNLLESRGEDAIERFFERLDSGAGAGGYREAVKQRRQGLSLDELKRRVSAREPVPGAMEVPSTVVLGRSYPGLGLAQFGVIAGACLLAMVMLFVTAFAIAAGRHSPTDGLLIQLLSYLYLGVGIIAGALAARAIGRSWRARVDKTLPRQRVLVLAPDGCIIGFRDGVRTLSWSDVGRFEAGTTEPEYEPGLLVYGANGDKLGEVVEGFLDAPLRLTITIAETYRTAAL